MKSALAVYKRIGVFGLASGGMDVNQPSDSMKVKLDARVPEKKSYDVVEGCG